MSLSPQARILKYELQITDEQALDLPEFARPLSVNSQLGRLYLWAAVIPSNEIAPYTIYLRGTGQPLTGAEGRFIGTVLMSSGLVWHVFDSKL